MPAGAAVTIVTGIPFSVTFNNGTATFTISGNHTDYFATNQIITAVGGAPNGGYQTVVSSLFSGGNTVVTVTPYSVGTAYPGPATYSTGSGTVISFNSIASPSFPASTDLLSVCNSLFGGNFIITGGAGAMYTSTNGTSWTSQTSGVSTNLWSVAPGQGGVNYDYDFAVGDSGTLIYAGSGDTSWTANDQVSTNLYCVERVTDFLTVMLACGAGGLLLADTNPTTDVWTTVTNFTSYDLRGLCYQANANYYVVGASGVIFHANETHPSPSMSWTAQTSGTPNQLNSVAGNQNHVSPLIVAVGNSGTIVLSTDNSTWSVETSGTSNNLYGVVWDPTNNLFVAVGASGIILTSSNGTSWTSQTSGTSNNLYAITTTTIGGFACVAVGQNKTVLVTTNDTSWTAYTA